MHPKDNIKNKERATECDSMALSSTPPIRRGSTPLPIKHQLRREEALHDDCDWTLGLAGPSSPTINLSLALDESISYAFVARSAGSLRIALLGQNGVGKSSLAISLVGDLNRTASVDSEEGYVRIATVDNEESTVIIYDNWRKDLSALQCEVCVLVFSLTDRRSFHRTAQLRLLLRETQPQTPIILVGNKSDLVRSREVSPQEASSSAALFDCMYLEISASLDHRTSELLDCAVRAASGLSPHLPGACGGGQRGSITSRAKRFLSSLVPHQSREGEQDTGKFFRQKSRSCHDLGAL